MKLQQFLILMAFQTFYFSGNEINAEPKKFKTTYQRHKGSSKNKPRPYNYTFPATPDDRCYICFEYIKYVTKRPRSMPSPRGNKCAHKLCLRSLLRELNNNQ
ncbi:MAG: hypothetical protein BWY54_00317 [Candidatus Dependentiae bacterium ADurb.Bin331]|nr:MAG: hypothetical protein BWY54_00317 [Candidatus Dependentiae bacterium ADurb.Bin331]